MRILKDYKRTTTSQERFSSLAVLYVHRDFEIDLDLIIDQFATMHPRRCNLSIFYVMTNEKFTYFIC